MVEHKTHNLGNLGSSPNYATYVQLPEWFNGLVCKTIVHRFESYTELKVLSE